MTTYGPYHAVAREVHDGDTVFFDIDIGFSHYVLGHNPINGKSDLSCRVFGINAPELSTDAGKAARDFAETLLPAGALCLVWSHGWDKYGGRYDGQIQLPDGRDYAQVMIAAGQAVVLTLSQYIARMHPDLSLSESQKAWVTAMENGIPAAWHGGRLSGHTQVSALWEEYTDTVFNLYGGGLK